MTDRYLIDVNAPAEAKELLRKFGEVFETVPLKTLTDATATHPDMQFVMIQSGKALAASELEEYYSSLFPDLDITAVGGVCSPYPNDCSLNFVELSDMRIITAEQRRRLPSLPNKREITVKQGYTKCSVCVLNDRAIITGDRAIAAKAAQNGLRAYFLPDGEITLDGYKNGFWGGCSGLLGDGKLFFTGDIEKLSCYAELSDILKKENVTPVYPEGLLLSDHGSVLRIF